MAFKYDLEHINQFNRDLYAKETKGGFRAQFFEELGGIEAMADIFKTDLATGVDLAEEKEAVKGEPAPFHTRRAWFGTNEMPKPKQKWLITMIWEHCQDETIIILSIAAVVSLALGVAFPETFINPETGMTDTDSSGWVEGVAILVAVAIIVMVGSLQDYDKERVRKRKQFRFFFVLTKVFAEVCFLCCVVTIVSLTLLLR
jgi:magnesium-transporting ATPase (P-type)